jgi:hypothetical protein
MLPATTRSIQDGLGPIARNAASMISNPADGGFRQLVARAAGDCGGGTSEGTRSMRAHTAVFGWMPRAFDKSRHRMNVDHNQLRAGRGGYGDPPRRQGI